jgi:hypothetical protein
MTLCHYAECHCDESRNLLIVMLNVIMLNAVMLIVNRINVVCHLALCLWLILFHFHNNF